MQLHKYIGLLQSRKAVFLIQPMCVRGCKNPPSQPLKIRVRGDAIHKPFGQPLPSMLWQDKDITKICNRCEVTDDASKANLLSAVQKSEAKRSFDGSCHRFFWNVLCPIRLAEESMNDFEILIFRTRANGKFSFCPFHF